MRRSLGKTVPSPGRIKPGLTRVNAALDRVNHPEESFASILVGGTNGKGSVCAMMESVLRRAGLRTGLYTSPHLIDPRERVRLNGLAVSSRTWASAVRRARRAGKGLTEFEEQTVAAFLILQEAGVDVAVLEVGLGGRLDAVNAVTAPELSVITSIGLDHTEWLGPTVRHIYREKRGIARPGTPLVQNVPSGLLSEARRWALDEGVPSFTLGRDFEVEKRAPRWPGQDVVVRWRTGERTSVFVPLWGEHQARNGALALAALRLLIDRGWRISESDIREGMAGARWPGRFELIRTHPPLVLDGAHNPQAAVGLAAAWRSSPWGSKKATVVFSCLKDKDAGGIVSALAPITDRAIIVPLRGDRAADVRALLPLWSRRAPTTTAGSVTEAWNVARTSKTTPVLVTGSLYLVGAAAKELSRPVKATLTGKYKTQI